MTESTMPRLSAGDVVELIDVVPGRPKLKPGHRGRVLIGAEELAWGMCTVQLDGQQRPLLLRHRYLQLVKPAPRRKGARVPKERCGVEASGPQRSPTL